MPTIAELEKLRARVEKERAKASGHDAAALDKIMESRRQAEADELQRELDRLQGATAERGKSADAVADDLTPEQKAERLIKAARQAMTGTPVEEIKAPKVTSAQPSTATNEGK